MINEDIRFTGNLPSTLNFFIEIEQFHWLSLQIICQREQGKNPFFPIPIVTFLGHML
jgi:hypothetical protein